MTTKRYGFCSCMCHVRDGVMHCFPCCGPENDRETVNYEINKVPISRTHVVIEDELSKERTTVTRPDDRDHNAPLGAVPDYSTHLEALPAQSATTFVLNDFSARTKALADIAIWGIDTHRRSFATKTFDSLMALREQSRFQGDEWKIADAQVNRVLEALSKTTI